MQMAVIEYARNVLKIKDATSSEISKNGILIRYSEG
jgi:CTP synthase (UTP-ammonia lyase)